jgi:hypothetical protein
VIEFDWVSAFSSASQLTSATLLRIHGERLPWRDLEELRLEVIHWVQKCAKEVAILPGASGSGS